MTDGQCAALAVLLEAAAPKPGNVHRGADFDDLTFLDLAASGVAIGPAIDGAAGGAALGQAVLRAVCETRRLVATNANLGMILLMVPLAKTPRGGDASANIQQVLSKLTADDAAGVYEAIRMAQPGGLGRVPQADVADAPPADLIAAMRLASDRDLVSRQYVNGFDQVLGLVVPALANGLQSGLRLTEVIVHGQMQLMSRFPDSLIARKCGALVAQRSADQASAVLDAGAPGEEAYQRALADFDFWLRSDGHRRNPGTTADLIAAGLFVALREEMIKEVRWP